MESTESYAAASPEEQTKRSPEPHDSSEAGIPIRSGLLLIPSFWWTMKMHFRDSDSNVLVFRKLDPV